MSRPLRIAAAQYPIDRPPDFGSYARKVEAWVAEAAAQRARLLVFPEYGAIELASVFGPAVEGDLAGQLEAVAGLENEIAALHAGLARQHEVWILGASHPARTEGRFRNRAKLYGPDGTVAVQDKIVMTRFEREDWGITGGGSLTPVATPFGTLGICICYDAEFPLLARALIEAGVTLLLVPSCTETLRGYHRVRIGAQARALEGQCITVQAPTVGAAPWSPAVDANRGAAGVFGPPDLGFPEDGVIALGELDRPGWVYADLDLKSVATVRAEGTVLNHRDWFDQMGVGAGSWPAG